RLWLVVLDGPHPLLFAGGAVETEQMPLLAVVFGAGDEDAPGDDDGTAVAVGRQRGLPSDVLVRAPFHRQAGFAGGDAVAGRSAKCRPVPGLQAAGEQR